MPQDKSRSDPQEDPPDSLEALNARLLAFARDRDWEQFHSQRIYPWPWPESAESCWNTFSG